MTRDEQRKNVTSLLLFSLINERLCTAYLVRSDKIIHAKSYDHEIPSRVQKKVGDDNIKCSFDFTEQLRTDLVYHEAVTHFMETHNQFICDLLSADRHTPLYLSALLNVNSNLAVFEVRSPRIPDSINMFRTFQFDYSVWHLLNAKDEQ